MIYLAGPFFNDMQVKRMQLIESACTLYKHNFFSPRSFLVLSPNATQEDRRAVFMKNVQSMNNANLVLACMDDKDTGTLWEMGYAYGNRTKVVGFYENEKSKVNVMLAEACVGFLRGWDQLYDFLKGDGKCIYDWTVPSRWKKEVF